MKYFEKINQQKIKENPIILGIESSCDETAASIICGREILSNEIMSSATEHIKFGGVVPEIASRAHTEAISKVCEFAIINAGITLNQIDAIAVTYGAGLLGALLVGVSYAKALAFSLNIPIVPVNHIRGHIAATYLQDKQLKPPFICLLASGGHTAVINVKDFYSYEILGQTVDDAAGEAFDKVARILKLSYPGGPNIEKLAKEGKNNIILPKMFSNDKKTYNFSYSGLKTAVINYCHNMDEKGEFYNNADVAYSFQKAATDVLIERTMRAVKQCKINTVAICGGVAANGFLRDGIAKECSKNNINIILPERKFCTDNAAMIAMEGLLQYNAKNFADLSLNAKASISL
jgi:N6-L-threonylcarbamoyladenine synthase